VPQGAVRRTADRSLFFALSRCCTRPLGPYLAAAGRACFAVEVWCPRGPATLLGRPCGGDQARSTSVVLVSAVRRRLCQADQSGA